MKQEDRRMWTAQQKMAVVLAIEGRGNRTVKEIAGEFGVFPTLAHHWTKQWADGTGKWTKVLEGARAETKVAGEIVRKIKATKGNGALDERALFEMIGRQAVLIAQLRGK